MSYHFKRMFLLSLLSVVALADASYFRALPGDGKTPIIFGSPPTGYFKTEDAHFLPPTFREPISFYKEVNGLHCFHKATFKAPRASYTPNVSSKGHLNSPFYLTNGYHSGKSFVFILNRVGEVVWSYENDLDTQKVENEDQRTRVLLPKRWNENRLALLQPYAKTHFKVIDWKGSVILETKPDLPLHHDFVKISENEILSLGLSTRTVRKPWKFWEKPMSFLGSPLVKIKLSPFASQTIWDYLADHNPYFESAWTWNAIDSAGGFWAGWNGEKTDHNFVHANSIDVRGNRIVISIRNLNKLVLLDSGGQNIIKTIEPSKELEFFRPHHATFLKNGNILLFDNGKENSSVVEITGHRFTPEPVIHSTRHGSAFQLPNGNILGFFPTTTWGKSGPNTLVEFDYETQKEKGRLAYSLGDNAVGYRAEPFQSLPGAVPYISPVPPCTLKMK